MSKYNNVEAVSGDPQHHYPPPPPPQQYPPPQKGTFQVVSNNSAVVGDPTGPQNPLGYAVVGGMPVSEEPPLPCGIGIGWFLFIIGFIIGIFWYVGAILLCTKIDRRERPGCIACSVGAVFYTIAIIIVATTEAHYLYHVL